MQRILIFGVALLLICGRPIRAGNPDDLEFRARLASDAHVFHMGEPLEIEISYSTQSEKKYKGSFTGPSPDFGGVIPRVNPMDGVIDLRELRPESIGGVAGSVGGFGYLGSQPITSKFDLCEWYRFQRPGTYSVVVSSSEIARVKGVEEGGGQDQLTLESEPVEFDVLPPDPAWVAAELGSVEQALSAAKDPGERGLALHRLALLNTPDSVQVLTERYLANSEGGEEWMFDAALHKSSQIDTIIPLLLAALSDPRARIPTTLPNLLADLETRRDLGLMPSYPGDPASQQKWTEESKARAVVHHKYFAEGYTLLAGSIERRTGTDRATAIYQLWYDANQPNGTKRLGADVLPRLESSVLAVADDLNHDQQVQFVTTAWQTMPHEQLLPMIRKLAMTSLTHGAMYSNNEAFGLWCDGWPSDCQRAILQDLIDSKAQTDANVVLLLQEGEHPELDAMLKARLTEPGTLRGWAQLPPLPAVILRAGSRRLVRPVDSFLDAYTKTHGCAGETLGDLLGYLLRVAPEDGRKRLSAALLEKTSPCSGEVLRTLDRVRPSADLIPVLIRALDSPNFESAQSAALYLGKQGPVSAEDALWRRLDTLWDAWQSRSSELPDDMMNVGTDPKDQAAMLERALASALSHAANWKLSPAELDRLRSGCLTRTCRDIADGKMYLDL